MEYLAPGPPKSSPGNDLRKLHIGVLVYKSSIYPRIITLFNAVYSSDHNAV